MTYCKTHHNQLNLSQNTMTSKVFYFGETTCDHDKCPNKASYSSTNKDVTVYICGIHKRCISSFNPTPLARRPASSALARSKKLAANHVKTYEEAAKKNKDENCPGKVMLLPFRMMKAPEHQSGFLTVFPNARHKARTDGYGLSSLSPKLMGPVHHNMPNLPVTTVEDFYQQAKLYPKEADSSGSPTEAAFEERKKAYTEGKGLRHKPAAKENKKKVLPLYSIYYDGAGKEYRFDYIQSRWFYCRAYELIARNLSDLGCLKKKLADGYNLAICGFDAPKNEKVVSREIDVVYADPSHPFGHELVIYCMLTIADPADYPWNKYNRNHRDIYSPFDNMFTQ